MFLCGELKVGLKNRSVWFDDNMKMSCVCCRAIWQCCRWRGREADTKRTEWARLMPTVFTFDFLFHMKSCSQIYNTTVQFTAGERVTLAGPQVYLDNVCNEVHYVLSIVSPSKHYYYYCGIVAFSERVRYRQDLKLITRRRRQQM